MREIKFRGKSVVDSEWEYGNFFTNEIAFPTKYFIHNGCEVTEIDLKTLGQYTGLKDKNGISIYEGDIIEMRGYDNREDAFVVTFDRGCFNCGNHCGSSTRKSARLIQEKKCKVIGNIHDNQELINQCGRELL